jgi:hypothetical protein
MLTWQGLEKTCIGIYFSDQIWVIKTEYLGRSTLKSNYYQTSIDFELIFFFNTLYTTTFMFTDLDFIHARICFGFLNENNHQEYSVLLVAVAWFLLPRKHLTNLEKLVLGFRNELLTIVRT